MGALVVRYRIEDAKGRVLTDEGFFTRERDDAAEFRSVDEAREEADAFPGATVERFERWSAFPDLVTATPSFERSAA